MEITKILQYQKLDSELFKIEKALKNNQNRKIANDLYKKANDAQARSVQLETQAKNLVEQIKKIRQQFEMQNKMLNQVKNKDFDNLDEKEVENLFVLKDKLAQNSNFLDKNLTRLAENVKLVIDEYQKASKIYNEARQKYSACKAAYDKELAEVEPKKKEIESKLAEEEKNIAKEDIEKYKRLRKDNIFPVFVPLRDNHCGGCNIELPVAVVSRIKDTGALQCEHCHRIIYFHI